MTPSVVKFIKIAILYYAGKQPLLKVAICLEQNKSSNKKILL